MKIVINSLINGVFMIDYSNQPGMEWLTIELQKWFHLASISFHEPTRLLAYGKIAELRAIS